MQRRQEELGRHKVRFIEGQRGCKHARELGYLPSSSEPVMKVVEAVMCALSAAHSACNAKACHILASRARRTCEHSVTAACGRWQRGSAGRAALLASALLETNLRNL